MSRALTRAKRPGEGGYALIEVLISALIVVLVTGAVIQTLVASGHASANERHRSQAYAVAQEDQARLRSMQISALQQGLAPHTVTLNGTPYSVTSAATYVSAKTGATTCNGEGRADYVRIASSVTWPQMIEGAAPVSIESIVSPTTGSVDATSGGLAIYAHTSRLKPQVQALSGVGISGSGPGSFSGSTNSEGCALFGGLPAGEYTVTPTAVGLIDPSGEPPQPFVAKISGGSTLIKELQYDKGGSATVSFSVRNRAGVLEVPPASATKANKADSIILTNPGMPPARSWGTPGGPAQPSIEATSLFPFESAYNVYAGSCTPAVAELAPEAGATASLTVPVGGKASATVRLPALYVTVRRSNGSPAEKIAVANVPVTVTDANCKDAGGELVLRRYRTTPTGGLGENKANPTLETPGLPTGEYQVCAYNSLTNRHLKPTVVVKSINGTALPLDLATAGEGGECP